MDVVGCVAVGDEEEMRSEAVEENKRGGDRGF